MAKRTPARSSHNTRPQSHGHGKGHCLTILQQLSAYIDDELPTTICDELRTHLGACPRCEEFLASLRDTVALCRHQPTAALPPSERAAMRAAILRSLRGT